jgi:hypothetical protein
LSRALPRRPAWQRGGSSPAQIRSAPFALYYDFRKLETVAMVGGGGE